MLFLSLWWRYSLCWGWQSPSFQPTRGLSSFVQGSPPAWTLPPDKYLFSLSNPFHVSPGSLLILYYFLLDSVSLIMESYITVTLNAPFTYQFDQMIISLLELPTLNLWNSTYQSFSFKWKFLPFRLVAAISLSQREAKIGTYRYIQELWRKKQSYAMHFLLKVGCWQYCLLSAPRRTLHPTRPHKACRLGHKTKQGYVTYQIPVSCVGHTCLRVPVTASLIILAKVCLKPSFYRGGVSWMPLWGSESPGFLLGWWRFYRQILWGYPHSIKLPEEILTPSGSPNQSKSTGSYKGWHPQV